MLPHFSPDRTRIGWIGTGVMGTSMCGHLLAAGYAVTVHNRTKAKTEPLVKKGAVWAESPQVVAEQADVIISIVGYPHDVEEVVLGQHGALAGCRPGNVLVDMTTSRPSLAAAIAERALQQQVVSIDAPVSGGDVGARNATLSIMIGGEGETVEALAPCWQALGKTWVWQGGPGAGQHTKMVNQILIATNMIGVCEALVYGYRAGLDLDRMMQSVATGAAGSWSLANLGPRIIAGNFDPGFFVEHFIKDMEIALAEAEQMELKLPGLKLARELYGRLVDQGHARDGTQALMLTLAGMSGIDWRNR
jgi:3-hydroxyisobutyrate dehydrogenase